MMISAYEVQTEPTGFSPCFWNLSSRQTAIAFARELSIKFANDKRYPNPFWVMEGRKALAKFWRGEQFAPSHCL